MSTEEELKWMTKRYSWRYIPFRYQALVATIVSAFLYFNLFQILFQPTSSGSSGACGSLLRPVFDDEITPSWFWNAGPFAVNEDLGCPRHIYGLWWQLIATFAALAICGLVMRRAIKREEDSKTS